MYPTHQRTFNSSLIGRRISRFVLCGLYFFTCLIGGCISGCAIQPAAEKKVLAKTSFQKVFPFPFESVWRASQLTLKYPIAVNNMENGILETEWIRADEAYSAPTAKAPSSGIRNKIVVTLVKGRTDNKATVRVSISKKIEKQKDFFSEVENLVSDGLEEKVLLYRIERELIIEEALKKASSQPN